MRPRLLTLAAAVSLATVPALSGGEALAAPPVVTDLGTGSTFGGLPLEHAAPDGALPNTPRTSGAVAYAVTVPTGGTGSYTFTAATLGSFQPLEVLYDSGLDLADPTHNVLTLTRPTSGTSTLTQTLSAGHTYVLAVTGEDFNLAGSFTASVSGPAALSRVTAPGVTSVTRTYSDDGTTMHVQVTPSAPSGFSGLTGYDVRLDGLFGVNPTGDGAPPPALTIGPGGTADFTIALNAPTDYPSYALNIAARTSAGDVSWMRTVRPPGFDALGLQSSVDVTAVPHGPFVADATMGAIGSDLPILDVVAQATTQSGYTDRHATGELTLQPGGTWTGPVVGMVPGMPQCVSTQIYSAIGVSGRGSNPCNGTAVTPPGAPYAAGTVTGDYDPDVVVPLPVSGAEQPSARTSAVTWAPFTVPQAGTYDIEVLGDIDHALWDSAFSVYSGSFDPAHPTVGHLVSIDDGGFPESPDRGVLELTLQPGRYSLAVYGYDATQEGAFKAYLTGPGAILGSFDSPSAPTAVTASATATSVTAAFATPTYTFGYPVSTYTVTATPAAGGSGLSTTVPGTATSATVNGLTAGTAYTVEVLAATVAGSGPPAGVPVTTATAPPPAGPGPAGPPPVVGPDIVKAALLPSPTGFTVYGGAIRVHDTLASWTATAYLDGTPVATTTGGTLPLHLSGLKPHTAYVVTLVATTVGGAHQQQSVRGRTGTTPTIKETFVRNAAHHVTAVRVTVTLGGKPAAGYTGELLVSRSGQPDLLTAGQCRTGATGRCTIPSRHLRRNDRVVAAILTFQVPTRRTGPLRFS